MKKSLVACAIALIVSIWILNLNIQESPVESRAQKVSSNKIKQWTHEKVEKKQQPNFKLSAAGTPLPAQEPIVATPPPPSLAHEVPSPSYLEPKNLDGPALATQMELARLEFLTDRLGLSPEQINNLDAGLRPFDHQLHELIKENPVKASSENGAQIFQFEPEVQSELVRMLRLKEQFLKLSLGEDRARLYLDFIETQKRDVLGLMAERQ